MTAAGKPLALVLVWMRTLRPTARATARPSATTWPGRRGPGGGARPWVWGRSRCQPSSRWRSGSPGPAPRSSTTSWGWPTSGPGWRARRGRRPGWDTSSLCVEPGGPGSRYTATTAPRVCWRRGPRVPFMRNRGSRETRWENVKLSSHLQRSLNRKRVASDRSQSQRCLFVPRESHFSKDPHRSVTVRSCLPQISLINSLASDLLID